MWDNVFKDIKAMPPLLPRSSRTSQPTNTFRSRRQAMTAREIGAFDDMFNMIFNAVAEQKPGDEPALGRVPTGAGMSDLFGKLRRHGRQLKWTTQAEDELDRKREEMELCDTDQQLLEWAMRDVFGASRAYLDAATRAVESAAAGPREDRPAIPPLQPLWYPHVVAALMRTFRDKYRDPHLALSVFEHARHLSIPSYVFGCATEAYNELLATRWRCFRDLAGVVDALEEMSVNAVEPNAKTRAVVESMRAELGALRADGGTTDDGVMALMERAEKLSMEEASWTKHTKLRESKAGTRGAARAEQRPRKKGWDNEMEWKRQNTRRGPDENAGYGFNDWGSQDEPRPRRMDRQSEPEGEWKKQNTRRGHEESTAFNDWDS
jgi:hypothetical protein